MKLDLAKDKQRIRRYIEKRIKDYPIYVNCGPGADEDPIQAVMLGFYAAQGGFVYLVFDTRPGKNIDGNWTLHMEDETMFNLPKWTYAPAQVHPGGMTAAGDRDGAVSVPDDELEAQVARSCWRNEPIDHR